MNIRRHTSPEPQTADKPNVLQQSAYAPIRPSGPQRRGWVRREIESLDPETDYNRIVRLATNYENTEFTANLGYSIGFHYNTIPAPGSEAIVGTGEAKRRPDTRFFDTAHYLFGWMLNGSDDPRTTASIERINKMHEQIALRYPKSFEKNEEFLHPLVVLATMGDRMRRIVGSKPLPRNQQIAMHHFWRDVSEQMRSTTGPVVDFPENYESALEFAREFESRNWEPTPNGRVMSELFIQQFTDKYFRHRLLRPLGRAFVLTFVEKQVRDRHQLDPLNPVLETVTKLIFRTLFFLSDHLRENDTPLSEVFESTDYLTRRQAARRAESPKRSARSAADN